MLFGGAAQYANTMTIGFDVSRFLYRVMDFGAAWHVGRMLQFLVAGFGMLIFLRSRGCGQSVRHSERWPTREIGNSWRRFTIIGLWPVSAGCRGCSRRFLLRRKTRADMVQQSPFFCPSLCWVLLCSMRFSFCWPMAVFGRDGCGRTAATETRCGAQFLEWGCSGCLVRGWWLICWSRRFTAFWKTVAPVTSVEASCITTGCVGLLVAVDNVECA